MRNRLFPVIGVVLGLLLMAGSATAESTATQEFVEVLGFEDLGVVSNGTPLNYQHTFAPENLDTGQLVEVSKVELSILLSECTDWVSCRYDLRTEGEWARIVVEDEAIFDEAIRYVSFVHQDITMIADIQAVGEQIEVTITSTGTDSFAAVFSMAAIYYSESSPGATGGDPTVPMPEPSSAVVFGVGLLVLSRRLRT